MDSVGLGARMFERLPMRQSTLEGDLMPGERPPPEFSQTFATFDPSRIYRYTLLRVWRVDLPRLAFIMLNPSTADEQILDPTIRRCIGYARAWGYGSLEVGNLFAFRSTSPYQLYNIPDPIGPENDGYLKEIVSRAKLVIAAWGNHGVIKDRSNVVARMFPGMKVLALTKTKGQPAHPLYLPLHIQPQDWCHPPHG